MAPVIYVLSLGKLYSMFYQIMLKPTGSSNLRILCHSVFIQYSKHCLFVYNTKSAVPLCEIYYTYVDCVMFIVVATAPVTR